MKETYRLRLKIAVPICLVFVAGFLIQGYFSTSFLYKNHLNALRKEQFNRVSSYAVSIDEKLSFAHETLVSGAKVLPVGDLDQADRLQAWLDDRKGLLSTFDNSLFIFSADGQLLVESPFKLDRRGRDYRFREYIQATIKSRQPFISDPFISTQSHNHPVIMMTAPVFDKQGQLAAIFTGSLDLLGQNFLGRLAQQKIGSEGYFYLAALDRTLIVHPDPSRIMKRDVPVGTNPLFDRAMNGYEGCEENINSKGLVALSAFKRLQVKDNWVLGGNFPLTEIGGSLQQSRYIIWISVGGTLLAMFLLILLSFRQIFGPLNNFAQHLSSLPQKVGAERLFGYQYSGELAVLTTTFNRMIQDLDKTYQSLEHAQKLARLGSWAWNMKTNEVTWSGEAFRIMGDEPQSYQPTFDIFIGKVHPDDRTRVQEAVEATVTDLKPFSLEHRILTKDKQLRYVKEHGEAYLDASGKPAGMVGTVQDISDLAILQNQLKMLATTDDLTGVANRREFMTQAEILYLRSVRYRNPFSMIFFDLDHFKAVNDTYGHSTGDRVLQEVSQQVQSKLRSTDILARYGGEEFCILLPETNQGNAAIAAEKVRQHIEGLTIKLPTGEDIKVTISLGVSQFKESDSISSLIERADQAVYQAKEAGRNRAIVI